MTPRTQHTIRRILLVEDNPADVRLVDIALGEVGVAADVILATDGAAAIRALNREEEYAGAHRPDLILLDLNIPIVSGRDVLAAAKADASLKRIPVVVMTSSSAPTDVQRCYALGANGYVNKPIDLDGYLQVVRSVAEFWLTVAVLPGSD